MGGIFVQLLRALVPPLVFAAILALVAAVKDLTDPATLVGHTLPWFAATALIAVTIRIALSLAPRPDLRAVVDAGAAAPPATTGG